MTIQWREDKLLKTELIYYIRSVYERNLTYIMPVAQEDICTEIHKQTEKKRADKCLLVISDYTWHILACASYWYAQQFHVYTVCSGWQCRKREPFQRGKLHGNKVFFNCPAFSEGQGHALWQPALRKVGLICSSARMLHWPKLLR